MTDLANLTPSAILSVPTDMPERLYKGSCEQDIKKVYRKLSSLWHPDKHVLDGKDTAAVFKHIKELYEVALQKLENGTWNLGKVAFFTSTEGKKFQVKYQANYPFDLGQYYISSTYLTWIIEKDYDDLGVRGIKAIENLKFANDKMKSEVEKYLPKLEQKINLANQTMVVMKKVQGALLLRDVLNHFNGKMPIKHAAWVISSMYNMACYLQYNGLMHGGITLDNYFINPQTHEGYLLGGWWFSHSVGEKLSVLNQVALEVAPVTVLNKKEASSGVDLEMIKLAGRQLLGDSTGVYLNKDTTIPKPVSQWLRDGAGDQAVKEYQGWHKVLTDSFGVRRFTEMNLTENDIYSKGE